jgi:flavin-dependent dehydrogenase
MKIVIVGGGTAGWLAAVMIKRTQPIHEVVVVDSSKLGIIGAGEGGTGALTDTVQGTFWDYGLSEKEFLKKTKATIKLSIRHKDWKELGHEYIAPIDNPIVSRNNFGTSTSFLNAIKNEQPMHMSSVNGYLSEKNKSPFFKLNGSFASKHGYAYNFDGKLVGEYFKESLGDSVTHIDSIVRSVDVGADGFVSGIVLEDGSTLNGDFFIDATGFKRLFAEPLNVGWNSYDKYLPVNTALPFFTYDKPGEKVEPILTSWAQKNGWLWKVPLQHRNGCGYVFDDRYTSVDDAKAEVEKAVGHEIDPIKVIKFDTGKLEKVWVNNCLFIGLSSSFLEPMEATSIHGTVLQLNSFIFNYLRDDRDSTCNSGSMNAYNHQIAMFYDSLVDFISIHYASKRTDSEFWVDMSRPERRTPKALDLINMTTNRVPNDADFIPFNGYAGASLHNWILAGLGFIDKELATKELEFYAQTEFAKEEYEAHIQIMKSMDQTYIDNTEFINMLRDGLI